ncbi:PstS family phosphate ABC transporter substrate-binding protein [Methanohalophilus halophilus]|uniref:Phosphate binding protein n=2 Tax=Methanohalophilus halophilus TaxID=2177 RepID=A0A1H2SQJ9_9EURY|nr:PstS family phosphate ABC transporter substrate-binding protein [Methanohalophilus halophilus]SDW33735.1 phosphate binding protein [Methanohalophilus halophilus]
MEKDNVTMVERSKILSIALTLIMVLALFTAGCVSNDEEPAESPDEGPSNGAEEAEEINVKGSTTVLPLAQAAAETYMENHPEQSISISGGGSGTGIAALIDGDVHIAMASRQIKDSEIEEAEANGINPVEHVIAWDGLTVVVNPENPVDQLTYDQIKGIYDGSISNWADVGGPDKEIVVINRDSSSGTYGYFQEEVLGEDNEFREDAIAQSSNGAVVQAVSQNDAAIGYIGFAYLNDNVKGVDVDKGSGMVEPTAENILAGDYPLARPLHFYTDGQPTGLAADFTEFILSEEGTEIVYDVGYFPVESTSETAEAEEINVKGSTTVLPLAQAAAETYMDNHPEASISISGGGSGTGIAALIDGDVDIAMASRQIKDSETEEAEANGINPVEHVIAWDGLTVVVNPANSVDQLTYDQIKGIYDGSISNWADVGGEDKEIVVINRDSSSGTYGYFQEEVLGEDNEFRPDALAQSSNGAVVQAVSQNDAAIGYIGFAYLNENVKGVDVNKGDGMVAPTSENILAGDYPLARPLHFYTDGQPTGLAADFTEFILSEEGTEIVYEVGYFPVE